jgi:Rad3-related DNA helicase
MPLLDDGTDNSIFDQLMQYETGEEIIQRDVLDDLEASPAFFDVPHETWRPSQWDALQFTLAQFDGGQKFVVMELPTGVGKTGIATALGKDAPVLVLVHTLSLLDQYAEKYGFDVVKGSQEYPCVLPVKVDSWRRKHNRIPTAADCSFDKMQDCPLYEECPYIRARDKALASRRMGCTYRYAAVAGIVQRRPGTVVLDEAHSAAEEILSMEEIKINEYDRKEFHLPSFPFTRSYGKDGAGDLLDPGAKKVLLEWLAVCSKLLAKVNEDWDPEFIQRQRNMLNKIRRVSQVIDEVEWFMEAGPSAIEYHYKGRTLNIPGIRLRPLSARGVAKRLWGSKSHALLMSATIGDPGPLASELGMGDYAFKTYPHPTPAMYRPVFDLGVDRMIYDRYTRDVELFRKQSQAIVKFINRWPKDWRGIILTSSYEKINQLRKYLTPPLGNRLANHGMASDMELWLSSMTKGEIAIQTMQGWGHGIDLFGDRARFMVMASVPFKNPTDRYQQVKQRIHGNADYFWWSCYVSVPQATGRVSRGEQDLNGNWLLNTSALADGSATTGAAMRFYPKWFKEAIQPLRD